MTLLVFLVLFYIGFIAAESALNFINAYLPSLGTEEEVTDQTPEAELSIEDILAEGNIDYTLHIAPLIATSCLGADCHSGDNPARGIRLETEDQVRGFFNISIESIQSGSMPIDRPLLSQEQILLLLGYKDKFFPEGGDALSPTDNETALAWRQRCLKNDIQVV